MGSGSRYVLFQYVDPQGKHIIAKEPSRGARRGSMSRKGKSFRVQS